jgi:hypothetical protein
MWGARNCPISAILASTQASACGTAKTILAIALGVEVTRRRFRVVLTREADVVENLLGHVCWKVARCGV